MLRLKDCKITFEDYKTIRVQFPLDFPSRGNFFYPKAKVNRGS